MLPLPLTMLMGAEYKGGLFTPGAVLDEMRIVDGIVDSLERDIASSHAPETFKFEWAAFRSEWKTFNADHQGILSRVLNKTIAMVYEYRDRALEWRKKFASLGGELTTPEPPETEKTYGGFTVSKLLIGAGIVGIGAWYFLFREPKPTVITFAKKGAKARP